MTFKRRDDDLVVETAGDELVIYDLRTDAVHCLDADASAIWRALETAGRTAAVASAASMDDDAATAVLAQLVERDLVVTGGDTRRDALRKLAVGAALTVPVVASIQVPEASAQASPLGCQGNGDCIPPLTCKQNPAPTGPKKICTP
jgi:hypothetical protein